MIENLLSKFLIELKNQKSSRPRRSEYVVLHHLKVHQLLHHVAIAETMISWIVCRNHSTLHSNLFF